MKNKSSANTGGDRSSQPTHLSETVFGLAAGIFLGVTVLKFPNPGLLDRHTEPPKDFWEFMFQPWPLAWGYGALVVLMLIWTWMWLGQNDKRMRLPWLAGLPLVWFGWQGLAALGSISPVATRITVTHFTTVVLGYLLGCFGLARVRAMNWFWAPLLGGFVLVLWLGFNQHYGGLEATRQYVFALPGWEHLPAEQIKRLKSDRIFSTLFYPNALAGAILLLLPPLTVWLWQRGRGWPHVVRMVAAGLLVYTALGCLFWTGSKAGWLIAIVLLAVVLWQTALPARAKPWVLGLVVALGLVGFGVRFAPYFSKGATSVGARMEYWKAAAVTAWRHPLLGTGPGTFSINYRNLKPPEAEMAQLTHNDYLQQACDSGIPGAVILMVFVFGSLVRLRPTLAEDPLRFAVWLGLWGWALQGAVEFGLYLPAISWPAFWLLGWLWGVTPPSLRPLTAAPITSPSTPRS